MMKGLLAIALAVLGGSPTVEETARETLQSLPGRGAFLFSELRNGEPVVVHGLNADERFAVGSTFKLFVFGELVGEVNAGRRRGEDVATLKADFLGPPASEMASWPTGSPVTLHTLALKMMSVSDNTATDHLLHLLGRERIEARMQEMGHGRPEINRPMLSTREMAMLRDKVAGLPAKEYQKLDEAGKRQYLKEHFSSPPAYDKIDFDTKAYSLAEWFASPMDMARALSWIERNTRDDQAAHPLRAILAVDAKLPHDAAEWPYVGFKGGSEDQLIAGNWLLRNKSGGLYTLHVYVNSPDKKVESEPFLKACERILRAAESSLLARPK